MRWWNRLLRRRRPQAGPTFDLTTFKQHLATVPAQSQFWLQLLALLDAYVVTEAGAMASPGLDDAEAHRLRGRIGMLLDLKAELIRLREEAAKELARGMTARTRDEDEGRGRR